VAAVSQLTYPEAVVVGAFQGLAELFPISSLGHSVLLPSLVGGRWGRDLNVSTPESPYLAFIVGLHVATAAALLVFFWRDWLLIIRGFASSVRRRRVAEPHERLAWLIVLATIPVGVSGLLLEHTFRTTLGRPVPAAAFLLANGAVLAVGERLRRRPAPVPAGTTPAAGPGRVLTAGGSDGSDGPHGSDGSDGPGRADVATGEVSDRRLAALGYRQGITIGSAQVLALLPGISRSGVTMVAGLAQGLSHEDAARFSFLLATPVIFAAGVLKLPDLAGPLGQGIGGPVLAGSLASFVTAFLSVRFLTRYFRSGNLRPFAWYCIGAGGASLLWLVLR
jgi:undecaprenyl-diphosphatase